jgi:hypothetical protein
VHRSERARVSGGTGELHSRGGERCADMPPRVQPWVVSGRFPPVARLLGGKSLLRLHA